MGKMKNAYNISIGKLKTKKPLGRTGCGSEDNIRMNTKETGWESVD
jgi:hypothetical protein